MTIREIKPFVCFIVAVGVVLGGLNDNYTSVTEAVFLVLCAVSVCTLLIVGFCRNKAVRQQRILKAIEIITFIWSISGVLFFSKSDSRALAICFMIDFAAVLTICQLVHKK